MDQPLKKISCDPMCGFVVQSHDEQEVLSMAMQHVSTKHKEKNMTMEQVKAMMVNA